MPSAPPLAALPTIKPFASPKTSTRRLIGEVIFTGPRVAFLVKNSEKIMSAAAWSAWKADTINLTIRNARDVAGKATERSRKKVTCREVHGGEAIEGQADGTSTKRCRIVG